MTTFQFGTDRESAVAFCEHHNISTDYICHERGAYLIRFACPVSECEPYRPEETV